MKYCGAFYINHKNKGLVGYDELKINYRDNQDKLLNFFKYAATGEKQVIVKIQSVDDMTDMVLNKYLETYANLEEKNFKFVLPSFNTDNMAVLLPFMEELNKDGIKYFFAEQFYAIDAVWQAIELGASDVYVCGELCFELEQISKKIHEAGVNIRVYPDKAMSSSALGVDYKKFFIRPEDIEYYEDYIDVCELWQEDEDVLEVLYNVYVEGKGWTLDLNNIIEGLFTEINNTGVSKQFGKRRSRCGKVCMKNSSCELCKNVVELSHTLARANMEFE